MDALADKVKETLHLTSAKVALPESFEKYAVTHEATSNSATWKDALTSASTPKDFLLTKTLVFKPKVAKTAVATLIMVVALENTATNAGQVAKAAGEKEARFAAADVVKEVLGVTVEQGTLLQLRPITDGSFSSVYFERECQQSPSATGQ
jgi:Aminoacyl-tRNA editing domain